MKGNLTYFLTPRTHIFKARGTKISCNTILPSYYLVEGSWYKLIPEGVEPITIQPSAQATREYISPASLATSGIYTEKDLEELRDTIMFPVEKSSFLNDVAREMHGATVADHDGTLMKLMNEDTMEKIIQSTWDRLWKKFMTFGTANAGVIAILLILQAIKMVIEVIINGFLLHRIYGWSIHMFRAILSSVTQCLIMMGKRSTDQGPTNSYNIQHKVESVQAEDQTQPLYSTISKTEECVDSTSTQESEEKANRKFFTYIP